MRMESRMARFIGRRAILAFLTVWAVITIVFVLMKITPGDQAQLAAGAGASPEAVAAVRERLGLDQTIIVQYWQFLNSVIHGDLGTSTLTHQPVSSSLVSVLPHTIQLIAAAMFLNVCIAVPIGIIAGVRSQSRLDGSVRVLAIFLGSLPTFWFGLVLQYLLSVKSNVFPLSGVVSDNLTIADVTGFSFFDAVITLNWVGLSDVSAHLLLPALTLAVSFAGFVVRVVRVAVADVLESDHITAAAAKGASPLRVIVKHVLRRAASPVVSLLGLQVGWMIGGAIIVEGIFGRPGVGLYLLQAVQQKDTFAVLGAVIFVGAIVALMGVLVDLFQILNDAQVRARELGGAR